MVNWDFPLRTVVRYIHKDLDVFFLKLYISIISYLEVNPAETTQRAKKHVYANLSPEV